MQSTKNPPAEQNLNRVGIAGFAVCLATIGVILSHLTIVGRAGEVGAGAIKGTTAVTVIGAPSSFDHITAIGDKGAYFELLKGNFVLFHSGWLKLIR